MLVQQLDDWHEIWEQWEKAHETDRKQKFVVLRAEDELTDKNSYLLRRFIEAKWNTVMAQYQNQQIAAMKYYQKLLSGCTNVAAVDIGWAGCGDFALSYLVKRVWHID